MITPSAVAGVGEVTMRRKTLATLAFGALLALGAPGAGRAAVRESFDDMVANLKSPNAKTRQQAALDLGRSRRREAVAPLSSLLRDPEPKVRLEMVRALRELRDHAAVPTLVTSLGDGDPKVREEALAALVELYTERERSTAVDRFLEVFSDEDERAALPLYAPVDASVYDALARALSDAEPSVRRQAAFALGILDGRSAVRELQNALQDGDPGVRGAAASALGKVGTSEDGRALVPLLSDASAPVRQRALRALGTLKTRSAGPALRELYETSRGKDAGRSVLEALARVEDPAQEDLFKRLIQDPDPDRKRLAIEGLARIADPGLLPAFKKDYQRERDEELRLALAFALTRLGDHAFTDSLVLCLPSRTLARRCRGYIIELGPAVLPELYPYLSDPDAEIRAALCDVLGVAGDAESITRLTPLLGDPSSKVADAANRAVERLKRTRPAGAR
jgi:HEAT repeat protein